MANYKKRPDGRYMTKVYLGRDENGKQKNKYVYANTVKELEKQIRDIKADMDKGIEILEADSLLTDWIKKYIRFRKNKITPKAFDTECHRLKYFDVAIGDYKIKQIKKSTIQELVDELYKCNPTTGKPTAKRTLKFYVDAISNVFEFAIEDRAIDFNPCKKICIPDGALQEQRRALTEDEQRWILETDHLMKLPAMLMLLCGLRRGEVCGLQWTDINFQDNTLTINKSYDFYSNKIKSPKTKAGYRTIPMPIILVDYLKTIKHTGMQVVLNEGKRYSNTMWQYHWDDYMLTLDSKYGVQRINDKKQSKKNCFKDRERFLTIRPFTPHCLRHTFCTNCYKAGIPVESCRILMGHSDITTTLKVYTHLDESTQKKSINLLDKFLKESI